LGRKGADKRQKTGKEKATEDEGVGGRSETAAKINFKKFEILSSKSETNPKSKRQKLKKFRI